MQLIPSDILIQYEDILKKRAVPVSRHADYKKWLRYYLDFCCKYKLQNNNNAHLTYFIKKLQEKNQTIFQQNQAAHAVSLYYELFQAESEDGQKIFSNNLSTERIINNDVVAIEKQVTSPIKSENKDNQTAVKIIQPDLVQTGYTEKLSEKTNQENFQKWKVAYDNLYNEIKVRHYSRNTFDAYNHWIRKFHYFVKNKDPELLTPTDVKEFLTSLAVKHGVSASTQNQAFNSLLFFYRHIIKKDFGQHTDIVRAKYNRYIPVVLTRKEIDLIIEKLEYPYDLVVKFLYGCGLRLFECLNLRINNFNFDNRILTIHDGKGQKDRTAPLPEKILPEIYT